MQFMFRSSADEAAREDASKRQHEAHAHHHQAGHVVGGRVFGYANRPVLTAPTGTAIRSAPTPTG